MNEGCWFNLPDGQTARELEVTVPVRGRVLVSASLAQEMDEWRELLLESMQKQKWVMHGRLRDMLASCISGYERIASDALSGAESVRDDMLIMLRSINFVLETVTNDHLNHFQKNERLRGAMSVIERHVQSLRQERFDFHGSTFRQNRDLFRWDERERRLRERIEELERQLAERGTPEDVEP